jgi:hypothetical protein
MGKTVRKPRSDKGMPRKAKGPKPIPTETKVAEVTRMATGVSGIPAMLASMKPKPKKRLLIRKKKVETSDA